MFEAKAKASIVFEAKAKASDHDCWKNIKMTFLIKIQLLNWQQNVYQSTKLSLSSPHCIKVLQIEHINYRPVTGGRCVEAKAKATILGPRAVLELEDSPRGPHPCKFNLYLSEVQSTSTGTGTERLIHWFHFLGEYPKRDRVKTMGTRGKLTPFNEILR